MEQTILDKSDFTYTINLTESGIKHIDKNKTLEDVSIVSFLSRRFSNYTDCLTSANLFFEKIKAKGDFKFSTAAEISPYFGGEPDSSEDWGHNEVCRLWLYLENADSTKKPVGCAKISLERKEYVRLN